MINAELSDTQRMTRDTAREFAREVLATAAAKHDREASFPIDATRAMGKLGFFGMLVPETWGGAKVDQLSLPPFSLELAMVKDQSYNE